MTKTSSSKPSNPVKQKQVMPFDNSKAIVSPFEGTVIENHQVVGKGKRRLYRVTAGDVRKPATDVLVEAVDESEAIRMAQLHSASSDHRSLRYRVEIAD